MRAARQIGLETWNEVDRFLSVRGTFPNEWIVERGESNRYRSKIHIYIKPVIFVIRFYSTDRKKTGVVI